MDDDLNARLDGIDAALRAITSRLDEIETGMSTLMSKVDRQASVARLGLEATEQGLTTLMRLSRRADHGKGG